MVIGAIGVVIFGWGIADLVAAIDVVPEQPRFSRYGVMFIVVGGVLRLPVVFFLDRSVRQRREAPVTR